MFHKNARITAMLVLLVMTGALLSSVPAGAETAKKPKAASIAAQALSESRKMAQAIRRETLRPYIIGPGDILEVVVWREDNLSRTELMVRPDGKITMPLVDDVQAAGFTPMEVKASLTEKFKNFLTTPQIYVTVKATESHWFSVLGNVNEPGRHHMLGPTSVLQALSQAKGFNEWASKNNVVIIRGIEPNQTRFEFDYSDVVDGDNIKQNILLWPGDVIIVP